VTARASRVYHIDPVVGLDTNPGNAPGRAWQTIAHAQATVTDGKAARFLLYPGVHTVHTPVILNQKQEWVGVGGRSNAAGSGADGVIVQAAADFTGIAVFNHQGTAVGDSWHYGTIENIAIDANKGAGVVTNGLHIFEFGEESLLRRVTAWNAKNSGFLFTGTHAVGQIEDCSVWNCEDYGQKWTSHPTIVGAGNGGSARLIGISGDNNIPGYGYANGSHVLSIVGLKAEALASTAHAFWTFGGSDTGGARGRLSFSGGRADCAANGGVSGGTFLRIEDTARPGIVIIGMHLPNLGKVIEDLVAGEDLLPRGSNAQSLIVWGPDGNDGAFLHGFATNIDGNLIITNGVVAIDNQASPATPVSGGAVYVESGALKYKGSAGTVTTLAPA
jgi:hypothetical protein